jgi:hypothetical protein
MKEIRLSQTVTNYVFFCEDDFESEEEFNEFVNKIKTDGEYLDEVFYENVDRERYISESDIIID